MNGRHRYKGSGAVDRATSKITKGAQPIGLRRLEELLAGRDPDTPTEETNDMGILTNIGNLVAGARDSIAALHDADRRLREEHAATLRERARILGAPPPRAEVVAAIGREVDGLANEWRRLHATDVLVIGSPASHSIAPGTRLAEALGGGTVALGALCGLLGDHVKAALVAALPPFEPGPPLADRPALVAKLDARLRDIEQRHTELVDHAREAGITLELMADESGRRRQAELHRASVRRIVQANADGIRKGLIRSLAGVSAAEFAATCRELGIQVGKG